MSWKPFFPFTDYFRIDHFVGHPGRRSRLGTTLEGVKGNFSKAHGLGPQAGKSFDYSSLGRDSIKCGVYWIRILGDSDCPHSSGHYDYIGLSANNTTPSLFQCGIYGRVFDHYRKLCLLPDRGDIVKFIKRNHPELDKDECIDLLSTQNFLNYEEMRTFFSDRETGACYISETVPRPFLELHKRYSQHFVTIDSIRDFFESRVFFRFNSYNMTANSGIEIGKGEGLALREYYHLYGEYPYLNSRDETAGLEGFEVKDFNAHHN